MNFVEILNEGISRSFIYDKINFIIDFSQLLFLDNENKDDDAKNVIIELMKFSVVLGDEIKGDYVEFRIIQGLEFDFDMNKSIVIKSLIKNKSDLDFVTSSFVVFVKSQFSGEFDFKLLEKRIDLSIWKKKKFDLSSIIFLNVDEISKFLEVVKVLLDVFLVSEFFNMILFFFFYNIFNVQGSYFSQGSRIVNGIVWRRYKQESSFVSVDYSEDEGDSIWVRRDLEFFKFEFEFNKYSLNVKKDKKEKGDKSFLFIKVMKSMFGVFKKEKILKFGFKMLLSFFKESL